MGSVPVPLNEYNFLYIQKTHTSNEIKKTHGHTILLSAVHEFIKEITVIISSYTCNLVIYGLIGKEQLQTLSPLDQMATNSCI